MLRKPGPIPGILSSGYLSGPTRQVSSTKPSVLLGGTATESKRELPPAGSGISEPVHERVDRNPAVSARPLPGPWLIVLLRGCH